MADECKKALTVKAYDFINKHEQLINDFMEEESVDAGQVGHTLWLATNGHGSGFLISMALLLKNTKTHLSV